MASVLEQPELRHLGCCQVAEAAEVTPVEMQKSHLAEPSMNC